jgi:hypothetical protein
MIDHGYGGNDGAWWVRERDRDTLGGSTVHLFDCERAENPTGILTHDGDSYHIQGTTVHDLDFMEGGLTETEAQELWPRRAWSRKMILSPRYALTWGNSHK